MEICYTHMLMYTIYTVCFRILIISLNTIFFLHYIMFTQRFHKMFDDGNLVKNHGNLLVKIFC